MSKKIKLLVEVDESDYEALRNDGVQNHIALADEIIANGTPITEGDWISRSELKENAYNIVDESIIFQFLLDLQKGKYNFDETTERIGREYREMFGDVIDNAQTVPQVTVFTESTDEKAVADMKAELQNVIEARPNEQIAWEQGYEAGLAQGKAETRPQGEWTTDEKGYFYCDQCGKYPHDQYATTDFCPKCGANMRKGGADK